MMTKKEIHVICSQHFDIVWRRNSDYYVDLRRKLYCRIFTMLLENRGMCWTLSQACPLREFLDAVPDFIPLVRELLHEGRLEIIGGMESICDMNMSSGTAILRNIEYGRKWFMDTFAHEVICGALEDAFGVPEQTPQMLKISGYKYYKADRMPHYGNGNISGDFLWSAPDGSCIRCISPLSGNGDWGWGFPDNPDDPDTVSMEQRQHKVMGRLLKAAETEEDKVLYVMLGEEHDPVDGLPGLLEKCSAQAGAEYHFSTYERYYHSLPPGYWDTRPQYGSEYDFSRLFTGCYTSRRASKAIPAELEAELITAELNLTPGSDRQAIDNAWRSLFVMQFHDAICGCHIDENAHWLELLAVRAKEQLSIEPEADDESIPEVINKKTDLHEFGDWDFSCRDGHLEQICYQGRTLDRLFKVILREDSGTLWTEEYSFRKYSFSEDPVIKDIRTNGELLELEVASEQTDFRNMWTGFTRFGWSATYQFIKNSPEVDIVFDADFMGNSTEVALEWTGDTDGTCLAGTPFGSRVRHEDKPGGNGIFCGEAFPANGWVRSGGIAVFNKDCPGHALRKNKLESIVLRSPVKRWSPFFPVTPSHECYDNGIRRISFRFHADAAGLRPAALHRCANAMRFGNSLNKLYDLFKDLPDNIVIVSGTLLDGHIELLMFEADGTEVSWQFGESGRSEMFGPNQIRKVIM